MCKLMNTKPGKSILTSSKELSERYKRKVVLLVEKYHMNPEIAVKKFHVRNTSVLTEWRRKYGIFDIDYIVIDKMGTSKDIPEVRKLKELLKAKDQEITRLKKEVYLNKQREIMVDAIIEVVKEDYNIDLLKKDIPGLLTSTSSEEGKEE